MFGPNPHEIHPMQGVKQLVFLKNVVNNPQIQIGEYTYYDDPQGPEQFEQRNVLYLFPFVNDRLIIGKFCALARNVRFIMNGANHKIGAFSTYPFQIFGNGWQEGLQDIKELPDKGDTVVGSDVWIGYDSPVMPGVTIGNGAIIASRSVVVHDVAPYTIVGGNPARAIRTRFSPEIIDLLQQLQWWDWPIEKITRYRAVLTSLDAEALRRIASEAE